MSNEHYKKATGRKTRMTLTKLIQDNSPKGIDTTNLLTKMNLSMPVLATHLKELEKEGLIESFSDPTKDRRHKFYRIRKKNTEQVKGQLLKYQATHFIESIHKPVFATTKAGAATFSLFASSTSDHRKDKQLKKKLQAAVNMLAMFAPQFLESIQEGDKMAITITLEGNTQTDMLQ